MFLISTPEPADARSMLEEIAASAAAEADELRSIQEARAGEPRTGPEGFGLLAAEFGVRYNEAVGDWARWALAQLTPAPALTPQPPAVNTCASTRVPGPTRPPGPAD